VAGNRSNPAPREKPAREPWAQDSTGRLVVGLQPVREVIRAHGARVERLAVGTANSPQLEALARFALDRGVQRVDRLSRRSLDKISGGLTHQGVVAWAPPLRLLDPNELLSRPDLLAVVLDGIEDPQNFGAVIRSAVALGRAPILWGEHSSAPLSAATFRASAGAVEHAELCRVPSLRSLLVEGSARGINVVGLDPRADQPFCRVDLRGPVLIVVGGEHSGLSRGVRLCCAELGRLGSLGILDSLNASVAAGIALYEASIQRSGTRT
jgi:23S rRNA (guanosine2251-2'-O)-methyltransferase